MEEGAGWLNTATQGGATPGLKTIEEMGNITHRIVTFSEPMRIDGYKRWYILIDKNIMEQLQEAGGKTLEFLFIPIVANADNNQQGRRREQTLFWETRRASWDILNKDWAVSPFGEYDENSIRQSREAAKALGLL